MGTRGTEKMPMAFVHIEVIPASGSFYTIVEGDVKEQIDKCGVMSKIFPLFEDDRFPQN